jgi:hypothetical protein
MKNCDNMDNVQANNARFIYTLTPRPPKKTIAKSKYEATSINEISKNDLFEMITKRRLARKRRNNNDCIYNVSNLKQQLYNKATFDNNNKSSITSNKILLQSNTSSNKNYIEDEAFKLSFVANKKKKKINLYDEEPEDIDSDVKVDYCRLNSNGFYFSKQARSDEKIRFSEQDIFSIVRTVAFIYVFNVTPDYSILDIINTGIAKFYFKNATTAFDHEKYYNEDAEDENQNDDDNNKGVNANDDNEGNNKEINITDTYALTENLDYMNDTVAFNILLDRLKFENDCDKQYDDPMHSDGLLEKILNIPIRRKQTFKIRNTLQLIDFVKLLDRLFGKRFATIINRPISKVYTEYMTVWRYYPFISPLLPSALDILKLHRFVNTSIPFYTKTTQFILRNAFDNKLPLQSTIKRLN